MKKSTMAFLWAAIWVGTACFGALMPLSAAGITVLRYFEIVLLVAPAVLLVPVIVKLKEVTVKLIAPMSDQQDPPKIAEFLLTALATTRHAEAAVGDLNERFTDECEKLGRRRAVRLYWARTLRSLWPLLRRAIGKALKWGAVIAAVRRIF